jgi:hypothetical protein
MRLYMSGHFFFVWSHDDRDKTWDDKKQSRWLCTVESPPQMTRSRSSYLVSAVGEERGVAVV